MNSCATTKVRLGSLALAAFISGLALSTLANNLQITNTVIEQTSITFDISWENSWCYDGAEVGDGYPCRPFNKLITEALKFLHKLSHVAVRAAIADDCDIKVGVSSSPHTKLSPFI